MAATESPHRKSRKNCKYNADELKEIMPFKESFVTATTIPERVLILRSKILPAMFNYWAANGKEPRDQEESQTWAKVSDSRYNWQAN